VLNSKIQTPEKDYPLIPIHGKVSGETWHTKDIRNYSHSVSSKWNSEKRQCIQQIVIEMKKMLRTSCIVFPQMHFNANMDCLKRQPSSYTQPLLPLFVTRSLYDNNSLRTILSLWLEKHQVLLILTFHLVFIPKMDKWPISRLRPNLSLHTTPVGILKIKPLITDFEITHKKTLILSHNIYYYNLVTQSFQDYSSMSLKTVSFPVHIEHRGYGGLYSYSCSSHSPPPLLAPAHQHSFLLILFGSLALHQTSQSEALQMMSLCSPCQTHPVYCVNVVGTQNAHNLITVSTDGKMCSWSLDMLSTPQESMELVYNKSKPVAVTGMAFPTGDVNNFVVGSEEGTVYTACRHG
ncbi:cytoplasmic dynein 1 intermediate chain 1, partial [Sigmodon hispidus]